MKVCSVIPARGGSKSIPRKNIADLGGKPLVSYTIDYSKSCSRVDHTIVSTDCEEIARISREHGAEVPFLRPAEYAQDHSRDYPVMRHALDFMEEYLGTQIDIIILLRPTSPLRPPRLIERALELMKQHPEASSVRSVAKCQQHPFRQWVVEGNYMCGYETRVDEPYNIPRQELPLVYFQTGDLEMIRRQTLLDGSVSGPKVLPLIIQPDEVHDIDHPKDLEMASRQVKS